VDLRGSRCEGRCSHGPNIRIEHQVISHMDKGDLLEVLEDQLIKSKGE
jgi:NADH:ubiquinone oxidoreductase subunit E